VTAYSASRVLAVGAELRAARLRAGLTQKQVADQIGIQHSRVSKWENGKGLPTEADLGVMLLLYEITGDERVEFLRLAREAADPNWVSPGVGRRLASLIESERLARRIVNFEPMHVPGLCQTPEYARAVMAGSGVTHAQLSQGVELRMSRQKVLTKDGAPEYVAIIAEYALRYPPCTRREMAGQLRKLLTLGRRPNVSILVLPFDCGPSAARHGPFVLTEPRQGDPVVRLEHYRSTTTLTNSRDVRDYQAAVEEIRGQAVGAAALIRKLLMEVER
jgi:transcriptional regulator with XRE-family HTH domain